MSARKKNVVLTMQQRLEVLRDINESSASACAIARKYNVSMATIIRIAQNERKISAFADKGKGQQKRRKLVEPLYDELDRQLLKWLNEERTSGEYLTDALLLEKAAEIKETLPSCSNFKASNGWLAKFKARHDIQFVHGKRSSASVDAMKEFVRNFNKIIEEENINLENVYSMYESGLAWKALPAEPLVEEEGNVTGYDVHRDRITVAFCANVLGTNKLKPMIIYKYGNPRALKHCQNTLPVIFKSQKNACMNRSLFLEWFENHFKPSVIEYQEEERLYGKVVLIVDDCEAHKIPSKIENTDNFRILYLPPNTASQPLNQGVIEKIKRSFRHKMLGRVLTYDGVQEFYAYYNIKDCIDILYSAWHEVTKSNIKNAWSALIKETSLPTVAATSNREVETNLQKAISLITGEECTASSMAAFLSACEEIESGNNRQLVDEDSEELLDESDVDDGETELAYILDKLSHHGVRTPDYIQHIITSLRLFFLGEN